MKRFYITIIGVVSSQISRVVSGIRDHHPLSNWTDTAVRIKTLKSSVSGNQQVLSNEWFCQDADV